MVIVPPSGGLDDPIIVHSFDRNMTIDGPVRDVYIRVVENQAFTIPFVNVALQRRRSIDVLEVPRRSDVSGTSGGRIADNELENRVLEAAQSHWGSAALYAGEYGPPQVGDTFCVYKPGVRWLCYSAVSAATGLMAIVALLRFAFRVQEVLRPRKPGVCEYCGYDYGAISIVACPECGRPT